MTVLMRRGPQTQAEISRQTGLSTATVSNLIKLLVAEGSVLTEKTISNGRLATKVSARRTETYYAGMIFTGHTTDLLITDSRNVTSMRCDCRWSIRRISRLGWKTQQAF
ncbi:hypothetical protein DQ354_19150 [Arthrobacter sp. AQ5-06]|nr:hypothetical protein DQ354_19150 [Arthrobacter sp. AQ5-06]